MLLLLRAAFVQNAVLIRTYIHTYTLMLYIAAAHEMKHLQIFWILHNLTASNKSFLHIGIMAIDLVS